MEIILFNQLNLCIYYFKHMYLVRRLSLTFSILFYLMSWVFNKCTHGLTPTLQLSCVDLKSSYKIRKKKAAAVGDRLAKAHRWVSKKCKGRLHYSPKYILVSLYLSSTFKESTCMHADTWYTQFTQRNVYHCKHIPRFHPYFSGKCKDPDNT